MAHSLELERPQHGNAGIRATTHSELESVVQLFIQDHSALQLTLSCDSLLKEHHKSGIPQCYITADSLTPPPHPPQKKRERSFWHHFYPIRAQSKSPQPDQQRLLCGAVHDTLLQNKSKHPRPDHQPSVKTVIL